ncbi:hypothetical protein FB45DRAFT_1005190 [Roridomyces roridus]|uniref:Uncharacterized protein n=1 Tax=Roridomyces roridus TaxID=1738132 RepID=A0AAD7FIK6_9AGAR|nr:hypothetical protein FB45DRAFT_1005190 [Roridomyces roridus]
MGPDGEDLGTRLREKDSKQGYTCRGVVLWNVLRKPSNTVRSSWWIVGSEGTALGRSEGDGGGKEARSDVCKKELERNQHERHQQRVFGERGGLGPVRRVKGGETKDGLRRESRNKTEGKPRIYLARWHEVAAAETSPEPDNRRITKEHVESLVQTPVRLDYGATPGAEKTESLGSSRQHARVATVDDESERKKERVDGDITAVDFLVLEMVSTAVGVEPKLNSFELQSALREERVAFPSFDASGAFSSTAGSVNYHILSLKARTYSVEDRRESRKISSADLMLSIHIRTTGRRQRRMDLHARCSAGLLVVGWSSSSPLESLSSWSFAPSGNTRIQGLGEEEDRGE